MALKLSTIISQMKRFRDPYGYKDYQVLVGDAVVAPKVGSLYFKSLVNGEGDTYPNYIQFFDVPFAKHDEKPNEAAKPIPHQKGMLLGRSAKNQYTFPKLNAGKNRVKVYCKCPDMGFTFSYQLWSRDSFIGAYKKYTRVPGSTRPPRNPLNVPGFCKHTMAHLRELQKMGYLEGI